MTEYERLRGLIEKRIADFDSRVYGRHDHASAIAQSELSDLLAAFDAGEPAPRSAIAPRECPKCQRTPPFPGGTRCQRLDCGLVEWTEEHPAQSATPRGTE